MAPTSSSLQEALKRLSFHMVDQVACGRALVWLGLLRRLQLRAVIDRLLPTEAVLSNGTVIEALVLNRLTSPCPLYAMEDWARTSGYAALAGIDPTLLNDDRIGRALDALAPRTTNAHAGLVVESIARFGIQVADINFDTTTLYLEGDYADSDLAARGHNKDGHPHAKQVKIALASTADGQVPLAHVTVAGNTGDVTTVPAALLALRPHLATAPVVISGDAAMWSQANMNKVAHAGGVFLGPLAMIPTVATWVCAATPDVVVPVTLQRAREPIAFRACVVGRFPVDGVADAGARLVVFDPRRAREEALERAAAITRYDTALTALIPRLNVRTLKTAAQVDARILTLATRHGLAARYVTVQRTGRSGAWTLAVQRDEEALAVAPARDGKWPLVTNQSGLSDAALCGWAVARYKQHAPIEQNMHRLKGPLKLRPIFLHSDDRIRGLVAVTVFALIALTLFERAARELPPQRHARRPAVDRVETLMAAVALATFRVEPLGTLHRVVSDLHPGLRALLRDLGWLFQIDQLMESAVRRDAPS